MVRTTKVGVGYNIQIAVDVKHKLIAEREVCNLVRLINLHAILLGSVLGEALDLLARDRPADPLRQIPVFYGIAR